MCVVEKVGEGGMYKMKLQDLSFRVNDGREQLIDTQTELQLMEVDVKVVREKFR